MMPCSPFCIFSVKFYIAVSILSYFVDFVENRRHLFAYLQIGVKRSEIPMVVINILGKLLQICVER